MKEKNLEIYYDAEADILEIMIGEPTPSYFDETEDDIFEFLKSYFVFKKYTLIIWGIRHIVKPQINNFL